MKFTNMNSNPKAHFKTGPSNIRFCEDCSSMMYLKQQGENEPSKYACTYCAYKHFATVICVSVIIIILIGAFFYVFYLIVFP